MYIAAYDNQWTLYLVIFSAGSHRLSVPDDLQELLDALSQPQELPEPAQFKYCYAGFHGVHHATVVGIQYG